MGEKSRGNWVMGFCTRKSTCANPWVCHLCYRHIHYNKKTEDPKVLTKDTEGSTARLD